MPVEKTLVIIKPDAVARGLMGRILTRFEEKGVTLVAMRLAMMPRETAEKHYAEHKEKPFFPKLVDFITSAPVVLMVLQARDAVTVVRKMVGQTLGRAADPGTIRGDFGMSRSFNLVHASDSPESAEREMALFFREEDFVPPPDKLAMKWRYDYSEGRAN
jgi:nucleoside-diphosphate kinase